MEIIYKIINTMMDARDEFFNLSASEALEKVEGDKPDTLYLDIIFEKPLCDLLEEVGWVVSEEQPNILGNKMSKLGHIIDPVDISVSLEGVLENQHGLVGDALINFPNCLFGPSVNVAGFSFNELPYGVTMNIVTGKVHYVFDGNVYVREENIDKVLIPKINPGNKIAVHIGEKEQHLGLIKDSLSRYELENVLPGGPRFLYLFYETDYCGIGSFAEKIGEWALWLAAYESLKQTHELKVLTMEDAPFYKCDLMCQSADSTLVSEGGILYTERLVNILHPSRQRECLAYLPNS